MHDCNCGCGVEIEVLCKKMEGVSSVRVIVTVRGEAVTIFFFSLLSFYFDSRHLN